MAEKQTILALAAAEEASVEVLFQKEVKLEIDVPVFHVQYGRDEICQYVKDVSKPELEAFTSVKKTEIEQSKTEAVSAAEEKIDRYAEENIKPALELFDQETIRPALHDYVDDTLKADLQNFADNLSEEFNQNAEEKTEIINQALMDTQTAVSHASDILYMVENCQQDVELNTGMVERFQEIANISAESALSYREEAQKWAIGSISQHPQGSAKYWAESINSTHFVRPGTVIIYPLASLSGYLICNGAAISRTTYADLFSVLGTTYGSGDGSTTFNLPDFRGDFIRGYLSGITSAIGKRQGEGLPEITGTFASNTGWFNGSSTGCFSCGSPESVTTFTNACTANAKTVYTMKASASSSIYGSSMHVTPRNHALNFLIKY